MPPYSRIPLLLAATAALLPAARAATETPADAAITLDATRDRGPVNPLIFGQNLEAGDAKGIFVDHHTPSNNAQGLWDPETRDFHPGMIRLADDLRMGSLRYPGGCLVHNFNWKDAVGPLDRRPDFQFGIDEWIRLCRRLGAEPVYTVADYHGTAGEAAELVEYLNAPATPAHPWAMKRAEWGHPEPYGVTWFELGNESDHGNHYLKPGRTFTPTEYAAWARIYAEKMKAVDPAIRVGITTPPSDGRNVRSAWNTTVFREAGDFADFVVVHFYAPIVGKNTGPGDYPRIHQATMAQTDQLGIRMDQYREAIKKLSGRNLPLAVTEYNTWAANVETPPYRFSFAPALQNADFIRLCLDPLQHDGVVMTQYWQMFNGWWGAVRGRGQTQHPAHALYRLWGRHREPLLLTPAVEAPRQEFAGSAGISEARGDRYIPRPDPESAALPDSYPPNRISLRGAEVFATNDGFTVELVNFQGESYPQLFTFPHPADHKGRRYHVSYEARLDLDEPADAATRKALGEFGLGLEDTRGWEKTKSAAGISGINTADDWRTFSGTYALPADGRAVRALVRLIARRPVTGTLRVRNLAIVRPLPDIAPAYPLLTSAAMKSEDGDRISLIVFNKSLDRALDTRIAVAGFAATAARYERITSADGDPASTATPSETTGDIAIPGGDGATVLRHVFPPCSMTAITLTRLP